MSKIRINNFGPIKEGFVDNDGWMDIKKVTVFIGDQGSGKSTVAKLISTFTWIEKALNRGDINYESIRGIDIVNALRYQGIYDYFDHSLSEIQYSGNSYEIRYGSKIVPLKGVPSVKKISPGNYIVPKIMYVPAERNFLSTIKEAFNVTGLPGPLATFSEELKRAQIELDGMTLKLPLKYFSYEYDKNEEKSYVLGDGYKINLLNASSGLQSLIPLYLVSRNLSKTIIEENDPSNARINANQSVRRDREISNIMLNKALTNDDKNKQAEEVYAKYHNKCFINIVEEPEQNLFPSSQRKILECLSEFNNRSEGNKLILTTHSPYIINFLSIAIQGDYLLNKIIEKKREDLMPRLQEIIPAISCINANDVIIYELDENGSIIKLPDYEGIPSDKNYLNQSLAECNQLFDSLLEIEQEL